MGIALNVGEAVGAVVVLEDVSVGAGGTLQCVVASAAPEHVVAGAALEFVVARAALERVAAAAARKLVVVRAAVQRPAPGDARARDELACGVLALVDRAGGEGADLDRVLAGIARERTAALAAVELVVAGAAADVHADAVKPRGVERVVARAHVADHRADAGEGLVPAVELDIDRAALARKGKGLATVGSVEILALPGKRAGIEGQRAARKRGQHRLDLGCLVLEVEQVGFEQLHVEQGDGLDPQIELDEHAGREARAHGDVEQVLGPAALVVVHGGHFAAADLAVADPGHCRDVAVDVLAQHRARDVLQVEAGVETDGALEPARYRTQVHAGKQADARLDVELVLLLAAGTGDDLAVLELRHREVEDVEAVQGV